MKILSFNIWDLPMWHVKDRSDRIKKITDYLKTSDAEIVCLQESFDPRHRKLIHGEMASAGFASTDKNFESRRVFFRKFDRTGGLAVFSKFPIIKNEFIPFNRFLSIFSPEYFGRKGMLTAVLQTPRGKIIVANTHLYRNFSFFDRFVRHRQMKKVLDYLNNEKSAPVILAGDFNEDFLAAKENFLKILGEGGFRMFQEEAAPSYRKNNPYNFLLGNSKRYDHIFCRGFESINMKPAGHSVIYTPVPLSDHDPILLTID